MDESIECIWYYYRLLRWWWMWRTRKNIYFISEQYEEIINKEKQKWADDTNKDFRDAENEEKRILLIAAIEHGLGINHRQNKGSRIINTKLYGSKGRHITQKTKTGVKFGGGLVSMGKKKKALDNNNDDDDDDDEKKKDLRLTKRGIDKPVYVAAKCDVFNIVEKRLEQFVMMDQFKEFKYNQQKYLDILGERFYGFVIVMISYDGYQSDGHFLSSKRALHLIKICGFPEVLEYFFFIFKCV